MKRCILLTVWFALLGAVSPAVADGLIIVDEAYWTPGPHPPHPMPWTPAPRPYVFAPLEVTYHHVNVKIDGQIASTSVDQDFYNPNPQRLEGTYLFPVPKGAQITNSPWNRRQTGRGRVVARRSRRARFTRTLCASSRIRALLEYADRDVFKVRVFPIEPRSHKRITLSYSQVLKSDAGLVGYVYPLNTEKFSAKPVGKVSIKMEVESQAPAQIHLFAEPFGRNQTQRAEPGHGRLRGQRRRCRTRISRSTSRRKKTNWASTCLTYKTGGEDGYFLLLASPGLDVKEKQVVPKDVAFVLDTSGSMAGKKLEQAKKALQFCVENLNDSDRFEIVRFSTEVEPLFDKLGTQRSQRASAEDFIKDLKADGRDGN